VEEFIIKIVCKILIIYFVKFSHHPVTFEIVVNKDEIHKFSEKCAYIEGYFIGRAYCLKSVILCIGSAKLSQG